jgi:hypothetical protein
MTLPSTPGLGSLLSASGLVDVLSFSAGFLSSKVGRGREPFVARRSKALLGRPSSFSHERGRKVARSRGRDGVAAGLESCFECLMSGMSGMSGTY